MRIDWRFRSTADSLPSWRFPEDERGWSPDRLSSDYKVHEQKNGPEPLKPCQGRPFGLYGESESESPKGNRGSITKMIRATPQWRPHPPLQLRFLNAAGRTALESECCRLKRSGPSSRSTERAATPWTARHNHIAARRRNACRSRFAALDVVRRCSTASAPDTVLSIKSAPGPGRATRREAWSQCAPSQ